MVCLLAAGVLAGAGSNDREFEDTSEAEVEAGDMGEEVARHRAITTLAATFQERHAERAQVVFAL